MELLNSVKISVVVSGLLLAACAPQSQNSNTASADSSQAGIIGGANVDAADEIAKSTVLLQMMTKDAKGEESFASCTGSLIRKDVILTAAHCVPEVEEGGVVMMIAIFAQDQKKVEKKDIRLVTTTLVHPAYTGKINNKPSKADVVAQAAKNTAPKAAAPAAQEEEEEEIQSTNDYAILKLESEAPAGYVPASILFDETPLMKEGVEVVIAGFGINDDIKKTNDGRLKKAKSHVLAPYGQSELATDQSHGQSICSGDSGGPAFVEVKGKLMLWGVASRVGNPENREKYCSGLAIHGRIKPQMNFIIKAIKLLDEATKKVATK